MSLDCLRLYDYHSNKCIRLSKKVNNGSYLELGIFSISFVVFKKQIYIYCFYCLLGYLGKPLS